MSSNGVDTAGLRVTGALLHEQHSPPIIFRIDSNAEESPRSIDSEHELLHPPPSRVSKVEHFPLLQLPYELRSEILRLAICYVRTPSKPSKGGILKSRAQAYAQDLVAFLKDRPSPLLGVNRQIRAEVTDVLKSRKDFQVRVTSYGISFMTKSLTTMIAQNRPKSFDGLPRLHISIWPPHPERPINMIDLFKHVKRLRKTLYALPKIPELFIYFENHRLVKWCQYEEHQINLEHYHKYWHNDMEMLLDHFARITKVQGIKLYAVGEMKESLYGCLEFELKRWDKSDGPWAYSPFLLSFEDWAESLRRAGRLIN